MLSISFCLRIQQPYQFKNYCFNDIGKLHLYEDKTAMAMIMNKLAENCYLPANKIILEQIKKTKGKFRIAFSLSGNTLELFEEFRPDLIDSFRELVDTGCVEILGETYYNSFSWLHSIDEFDRQVKKHDTLVKKIFGYEPLVFRNTEFIHDNKLAKHIAGLGYKGMLTDGVSEILNGRSPNQTYAAPDNDDFGLMLRNAGLSEDIACWIGKAKGSRYALTAEKFLERHSHDTQGNSCNVNVFLDYETFGIHKTGQGIFTFLEELPGAVLLHKQHSFKTPTEVLDDCYPKDIYDVPRLISISDDPGINYRLCDNVKKNEVLKKLYKFEKLVHETGDSRLLATWGKLQAAEHFCFIQGGRSSEMHSYHFTDYVNYTTEKFQQIVNILTDFEISLLTGYAERNKGRFNRQMSTMLF
jgi:alpha-amylase